MVTSSASTHHVEDDTYSYFSLEDNAQFSHSYSWMHPIEIEDDDLMFGGKSLSAWYEEERQAPAAPVEEERRGRQRVGFSLSGTATTRHQYYQKVSTGPIPSFVFASHKVQEEDILFVEQRRPEALDVLAQRRHVPTTGYYRLFPGHLSICSPTHVGYPPAFLSSHLVLNHARTPHHIDQRHLSMVQVIGTSRDREHHP